MSYRLAAATLTLLLLSHPAWAQEPRVRVFNLTIGTNLTVNVSQRMARCEVSGSDAVRVKCEQNGSRIELFPFKNGKTTIFVYEAMERRLFEEIRVNVCSKALISLYDQAADRYHKVDGLVIDIDDDQLVFSGEIFSLSAYEELQALGAEGKYRVEGVKLHPYVNAVLAAAPSDLGPLPGQELEAMEEAAASAPPEDEPPADDAADDASGEASEAPPEEAAPAEETAEDA